jgi:hypothetical protein
MGSAPKEWLMDPTDLVGRWRVIRCTEELPDGREVPAPWNEGFLAYWSDGTMIGILDHSERGPRTAPGTATPAARATALTPDEQLRALERFGAYAGTYTLDGDVVTHHVQFSLNPQVKGRELRRTVRIENGHLVISTRNLGNPHNLDLVLERVGAE